MNEILTSMKVPGMWSEFDLGVIPSSTIHRDILFDGRLAGSFHLTPGNSYGQCLQCNHSAVHWDLIQIQTPEYGGGEIWFDDVLIRKDGRFLPEELQCLNPENLLSEEQEDA
jgi:aminopeptidase